MTGTKEEEKLEVHLRDGAVLFCTVEEDDQGVESLDRLDAFIEDVVQGAPRWVWIGEAYVFNRAIAAIQYGDSERDLIGLPYPVGLEGVPEAA